MTLSERIAVAAERLAEDGDRQAFPLNDVEDVVVAYTSAASADGDPDVVDVAVAVHVGGAPVADRSTVLGPLPAYMAAAEVEAAIVRALVRLGDVL